MNGAQPRRSGVEELGHKLHRRCISGIVFEKHKDRTASARAFLSQPRATGREFRRNHAVIPRENVANQEEIFFLLAYEQDAQWRRGGFLRPSTRDGSVVCQHRNPARQSFAIALLYRSRALPSRGTIRR